MRICLFEDRGAADLEPLSQTRPVFDLLCGTAPLADQQARAFPGAEVGLLVRPGLAEVVRLERPGVPVNDRDWLRAGPVVLINGRWLPPLPAPDYDPTAPCVGVAGGAVAFAAVEPHHLPADPTAGLDDTLERLADTLPNVPAGGAVVRHLWELAAHNPQRLCDEYARRAPDQVGPWEQTGGWRPEGTVLVGPAERLWIDPAARVEPLAAFDTTHGPITVEAGAVVQAFSRLDGPCHVGAGSQVRGARLRGGTTLGPHCRVGGEVEGSILQGYVNKYHDGFLGHSYVGAWVNLGAGSQCSDLRHDYGEVTVPVQGAAVATGMTKVGCFVGDHAKIGVGCLLNTGTSAGAFSQLLPAGRLLPRHVPAFCGTAFDRLAARDDLDAMLATAAAVMARRGQELTAARAAQYRRLYAQTAGERRQALRDAERRRLRRSA
jgi:UDP-N-acetylglucosamine diphosphorylase/glucosamine-1-phosphate N-acetyltransferase